MSNNSNDTIFIGKKPLMTYVTSTIVQLATKPKVTIKARGLTTSIAIDVSQIVLKKILTLSLLELVLPHHRIDLL